MNKNLIRHKISYEAALLIAQMGVNDFQYAKNKAAKKLGISDIHLLPSNEEILHELKNYKNLFSNPNDEERHEWQQHVLKIMGILRDFAPKIANHTLNHELIPNCYIEIYVSAASLEEICIFLLDKNIPYDLKEKKITLSKNKSQVVPYFDLIKEKYKIQLTFLAQEKPLIRPINPIDNKPIQFLDIKQSEAYFKQLENS